MSDRGCVAVIIAAYNSAATIAAAVASALAEPETAEVIVVDDASRDDTAGAALAADDGSGRLRVIRQPANAGPSAARNAAIAASGAPYLAVLDADDFFLAGRLARLLRGGDDWDFIADNIAFVTDASGVARDQSPVDAIPEYRRQLSLEEFVLRNISRPGHPRGEYGFMKPLMRRAALDRLGLRYDEALRLGEDFVFYASALGRGARFALSSRVGYIAVERPNSLSGRHSVQDLRALRDAAATMAAGFGADRCPPGARAALRQHGRQLEAKIRLREFLETKDRIGRPRALAALIPRPARLGDVALGLLRDRRARHREPAKHPRLLFDQASFE